MCKSNNINVAPHQDPIDRLRNENQDLRAIVQLLQNERISLMEALKKKNEHSGSRLVIYNSDWHSDYLLSILLKSDINIHTNLRKSFFSHFALCLRYE
ncbi:unnamed protein product [Rotaria socialis]